MKLKNIADTKDRTVTIEPDGSLKTKDGLFVYKIHACGYESKYDELLPRDIYVLAKAGITTEDVKEYLLSDPDLETLVTDWDEEGVASSWDEYLEIQKVRVA